MGKRVSRNNKKTIDKIKRLLKGPTVNLIVGREQQAFTVHRTLLCRQSRFFINAFTGPWSEGRTGAMRLPDVEPEIMSAFVDWLYTAKPPHAEIALDLYVFADCYQMHRLKNAIVTSLYAHWTEWNDILGQVEVKMDTLPGAQQLHFAMDNLPETSPLLQLMFAIHANWSGKMPEGHDWEELKDAMCRLVRYLPWRPRDLKTKSGYLEEEEGLGKRWRGAREDVVRAHVCKKMKVEDDEDDAGFALAECRIGTITNATSL
ncbi:uncharacterized protein J3D65DRAFT_106652 [Phyllosticta citribraziliensis]|uniref:BTB domain-containing protein n=1 Tax=Phyllosticta citribraziliensis TaxID=989973 RepID=A0ABR1LDA5_9PEZI